MTLDDFQNQPPPSSPVYAPGFSERSLTPPPGIEADIPSLENPHGNPLATILAWMIILGITGLLVALNFGSQYIFVSDATSATAAERMQVNFQAKVILGMEGLLKSILGDQGEQAALPAQDPSGLDNGPPEIRCGYSVVVNELEGPEAALMAIDELATLMDETEAFTPAPDQERLVRLLGALYEGYAMGQWDSHELLPPEDRDFVADELGWTGQIALNPKPGPDGQTRQALLAEAQSTIVRTGILVLGLLVAGVAGLAIAVVLFVMFAGGGLRSWWYAAGRRGGIYAETFAVWMVLFLAGSIGGGLLDEALRLPAIGSLILQLMVFFGSLIALAYPVFRGIPFEVVRADIGWRWGNPVAESGLGLISYVGWLPAMTVGLMATAFTAAIITQVIPSPDNPFVSSGGGSHPIQDELATGNFWVIVGVFLTTCVAAPIVEETVFRGVLYRHLREVGRLPRELSVIFGAVVSSFIFAVIHPQGIIGVPVLMTLAFGFALCREWRGSLVGPMAMHAVHNSIVTCFLITML